MTVGVTTLSGKELTIGTGTGTKWQWIKKSLPKEEKGKLLDELVDQIAMSLTHGFRHIDTADNYTTQPEVGAAIKKSGVRREDIWLSTKHFPGLYFNELPAPLMAPYKGPLETLDAALKELDTPYIDLFLVHFPFFQYSKGETLESCWKEMVTAKKEGKVRHIGVCNFAIEHIEACFKATGVYPEVNQIEFHPYLQNQTKDIVKYCESKGIILEAFGSLTPLFRISKDNKVVENHPLNDLLPKLSEKYSKSQAQILLRYTIQKGLIPITTSSRKERVQESLDVLNFALSDEDVALISEAGSQFKFRGFFGTMYDDYE